MINTEMRKKAQEYKKEMVGERYRHFKGDVHVVLDIAIHTETEEMMVVYKEFKNPMQTYVRPLEMFLSKVDKEKYPDVEQEYRFEKMGCE